MKTMFTRFAARSALLIAFGLLTLSAMADVEPNNSIATANPLALGTEQSGSLGDPGDNDDYYSISIPEDGSPSMTVTYAEGLSGTIYFYNPAGGLIASQALSGTTAELSTDCIGEGLIYVRLNRNSGSGEYSLEVNLSPTGIPNDAEPNNTFATIQEVFEVGEIISGHIGYTGGAQNITVDSDDWFTVNLPEDGTATLTVDFDDTFNGSIFLYSAAGGLLASQGSLSGEGNSISASCRAAGEIVVRIFRNTGCSPYEAVVTLDPASLPADAEPNNLQVDANEFYEVNENFTGRLGYQQPTGSTDVDDWIGIEVPEDGNVNLEVSFEETLFGSIFIYSKVGGLLASSTLSGTTTTITANCIQADTVYARLFRSSGCGSYSAQATADQPEFDNDIEPNGTLATAAETFLSGQEFQGHIGYFDSDIGTDVDDYFNVIMPVDGTVTFDLEFSGGGSGSFFIYSKVGGLLASGLYSEGTQSISASCVAADTVVARIFRGGGCGSYIASLSVSPIVYQNDEEPNGSLALATSIEVSQETQGHLGYSDTDTGVDTDDWYEFEIVAAPFELEVSAEFVGTVTGTLWLYTGAGGLLANTPISEGDVTLLYTITTPGTYAIRLFRGGGCGQYLIGDLCANDPEVAILEPDAIVCPGEEATFSATAGFAQYQWIRNGGVVGAESTLNTSTPGSYTVSVFDENGCVGISNAVNLSNYDVPELEISAEGPTEFCQGESVALTASSGFDSYLWSNGETTQTIDASESGTYSVTGTSSDGCETESNVITIVVSTGGECEVDCAGVPGGSATVDDCGVCDDNPLNDNETCTDCAGVVNGSSTVDECGVCDDNPNNDNETCADCEGVPNGSAQVGTPCVNDDGDEGTWVEGCLCDTGDECEEDLDEDGICDDVDDCVGEEDALGVCNGECEADEDSDGICDDVDDCVGEVDALGICNGSCEADEDQDGICDDIDDCVGELDAIGICNGDCENDSDEDGICDDEDDCIGEVDAIGVCNGGCEADVDADGICDDVDDCVGELDALGICNGSCEADEDQDGICDDIDDCVGELDAIGVCNGSCQSDEDGDGICDDAATDCENYVYYLSNTLSDGTTNIYEVELDGNEAQLALIGTSEYEVHLAYNEDNGLIYAVRKLDGSYRVFDPLTGIFGPVEILSDNLHQVVGAAFNTDGKLMLLSQSKNAVFSINIATNQVSVFDSYSPVLGGDIDFSSDGSLYLATREGFGTLYLSIPDEVGPDILVGDAPQFVTGIADTENGNFILSHSNSSTLEVRDYNGDPGAPYNLTLDGEPFETLFGDLTSGCAGVIIDECLDVGECFATSADYVEGTLSDGGSISPSRTDVNQALGQPEFVDELVFTSLGFGGSLTFEFDGAVINDEGPDLQIVEVSFGNPGCESYPEYADVSVSVDGDEFYYIGTVCKSDPLVDISNAQTDEPLTCVYYVRVENNDELSTQAGDGFDVDGIIALHNCNNTAVELVANQESLANHAQLSAYPNPSSGLSQAVFSLETSERATLEVYDMNGRLVQELFNGIAESGVEYRVDFDGLSLPNGVYMYRLTSESETIIEKFMIAK
jgi:hypothetical protein